MKVIVVGAGVVGWHIGARLSSEGHEVILIDKSEARVAEVQDTFDGLVVCGNGASPEVLKQVGVDTADILVAVTERDEINIVSCVVAGLLNPSCITIARARDPDFERNKDLFLRGPLRLDLFINPEVEASERVVRMLRVPAAEDILELADGSVLLVAVRVRQDSRLVGLSMRDLARLPTRFLVAGLLRGGKWVIPRGEDRFYPQDLCYLAVSASQLDQLMHELGIEYRQTRSVVIYGGTGMGLHLARRMEEERISVRLIEEDRQRCEFLAGLLGKTIVLHGSGTDQLLLREEHVAGADAFVAVTGDEESDLIAALLAKSLGTPVAVVAVTKPGYSELVRAIGIDKVVSPQLEAASAILRYIRKGDVRQVAALREEGAEVISFRVGRDSPLSGKTLAEAQFPRDAIVMALVRGEEVVIPDGSTRVTEGDTALVFATREAMARLEKFFVG